MSRSGGDDALPTLGTFAATLYTKVFAGTSARWLLSAAKRFGLVCLLFLCLFRPTDGQVSYIKTVWRAPSWEGNLVGNKNFQGEHDCIEKALGTGTS